MKTQKIGRIAGGLLLLVCWLATTGWTADQFKLAVPGNPNVRSTAIVDASQLVIVDRDGNRFEYARQDRLDSPAGDYWGYYCAPARQYLRWPKNGTGAMYIGTAEGRLVSWKKSQMQLRRMTPKPGAGALTGAVTNLGPTHIDAIADAGQTTVAQIDDRGQLFFYRGNADKWVPHKPVLRELLVPGAPLQLDLDRKSKLPFVYTVNSRGEVIEIRDGSKLRIIADKTTADFAPQSHLVLSSRGRSTFLVMADRRGRIWELDIERGRHQLIERRAALFAPGLPIALVADRSEHLLLIDQAGTLVRYELRGGTWNPPAAVAVGFAPGGEVAASMFGAADATIHIAAVDATGRLRVLSENGRTWHDHRIGTSLLPPGSPVSLAALGTTLSVTAVHPDGRWTEWYQVGPTRWDRRDIARGFPTGAPILLQPNGPFGFAVDRTGRLIAGHRARGRWQCAVCSPLFDLAPRLVRRSITPNESLESVEVVLANTHKEDLVVRMVDTRTPDQPFEFKIPSGKTRSQRIQRDNGATLEEVYLVPNPRGGFVEEVHRHRLPPQRIYDVVVYADRVTSVYFDRTTNKTDKPDEQSKSLVSIGVFPIPSGDRVQDGDEIDVFRQASRLRNPGAVRLFD